MNNKELKKEIEKFEKVVEYQYPNGKKFDGSSFEFYLLSIIFYFLHIMFSPFTFQDSIFCGKRKIYWRKI